MSISLRSNSPARWNQLTSSAKASKNLALSTSMTYRGKTCSIAIHALIAVVALPFARQIIPAKNLVHAKSSCKFAAAPTKPPLLSRKTRHYQRYQLKAIRSLLCQKQNNQYSIRNSSVIMKVLKLYGNVLLVAHACRNVRFLLNMCLQS